MLKSAWCLSSKRLFEAAVVYACASVAKWHGRVWYRRTNRLTPGPRYNRGLFTSLVGLHKRKKRGLETWALFIDFVKALDTVPRETSFAIYSVALIRLVISSIS